MSDLVGRLRLLCSPDAERMSDYERINVLVATGHKAADRIEQLEAALRKIIGYNEPGLLIQTQGMRRVAAAALASEQDK